MAFIAEIKSYVLAQFCPPAYPEVIWLYDAQGARVGTLRFVRSQGAALAPPTYDPSNRPTFYLFESQYPFVVDMLRNEGPCEIRLDDTGEGTFAFIVTRREAAGGSRRFDFDRSDIQPIAHGSRKSVGLRRAKRPAAKSPKRHR